MFNAQLEVKLLPPLLLSNFKTRQKVQQELYHIIFVVERGDCEKRPTAGKSVTLTTYSSSGPVLSKGSAGSLKM